MFDSTRQRQTRNSCHTLNSKEAPHTSSLLHLYGRAMFFFYREYVVEISREISRVYCMHLWHIYCFFCTHYYFCLLIELWTINRFNLNLSIPRINISFRKYRWHQSRAFPVSIQCHRLSTVIHRQWQEPTKCCKQLAGGPKLKTDLCRQTTILRPWKSIFP